jgi:hypothetical protein
MRQFKLMANLQEIMSVEKKNTIADNGLLVPLIIEWE